MTYCLVNWTGTDASRVVPYQDLNWVQPRPFITLRISDGDATADEQDGSSSMSVSSPHIMICTALPCLLGSSERLPTPSLFRLAFTCDHYSALQ